MARPVRISVLSTPKIAYLGSHSETLDAAHSVLDQWLGKVLCDKPDLIVLPENCDIPGCPDPEVYLSYCAYNGNKGLDHMKNVCLKNHVNMCYCTVLDGGDGWNRKSSVFIGRDGQVVGTYHKNHLVWEEYSDRHIKFGKDPQLIEMDFGKVGGVICYDLNFDELREKYMHLHPELLLFSSYYHGGFVQRNWAYSNRCWFVGCIAGAGRWPCSIINPLGEIVAETNPYRPYLTVDINLDYCVAHLDYNGSGFEGIKAKYGPQVTIDVPAGLGCALITSNSETVSASEMAEEFDIELLDTLFQRSLENRHAEGHIEA